MSQPIPLEFSILTAWWSFFGWFARPVCAPWWKPRLVHEAIGGFDEQFGAYGGAMDLSWRARAAGFAILSCPYAVFRMPAEEEPTLAPSPAVLADALALAHKWGLNSAEADITSKLRWIGHPVPATPDGRMSAAQREAAQPERTLRLREPSW